MQLPMRQGSFARVLRIGAAIARPDFRTALTETQAVQCFLCGPISKAVGNFLPVSMPLPFVSGARTHKSGCRRIGTRLICPLCRRQRRESGHRRRSESGQRRMFVGLLSNDRIRPSFQPHLRCFASGQPQARQVELSMLRIAPMRGARDDYVRERP
jgi:hypothetical protein